MPDKEWEQVKSEIREDILEWLKELEWMPRSTGSHFQTGYWDEKNSRYSVKIEIKNITKD